MTTKRSTTRRSTDPVTNPHVGSDFEEFLAEEGLLVAATEQAIERVRVWQHVGDRRVGPRAEVPAPRTVVPRR